MELRKYPLLELLLEQEAPARSSRRFFVPPLQYFLRISDGVVLGCYTLSELLL